MHSEENQIDYVSTENSAIKILEYCDYIKIYGGQTVEICTFITWYKCRGQE